MCVPVSCNHFAHSMLLPFSPIVVTMPSSNSADLLRERWENNANFCDEDYHYDSLVFCQHHIDLEFDENKMEPARQEEGSSYVGLDPVFMSDNSQPPASKKMNQDCCRANRSQYQLPRSDAKDEERLAKRKDDMPPPLLRRTDNPKIREDLALLAFCSNTDKIHYATSEDAYAKAWFNYSQSIAQHHCLKCPDRIASAIKYGYGI